MSCHLSLDDIKPFQVNSACNLSPGKKTEKRMKKLDHRRSKVKAKQGTREAKRKRLAAKQLRHTAKGTNELGEGVTYQSNIDFSGSIDEDDILEIPVKKPKADIKRSTNEANNIIIFDIETTGFGKKINSVCLTLSARLSFFFIFATSVRLHKISQYGTL